MDTLESIRAQRAEVEALLAFRHAKDDEARRLAWWRLQRARQARLDLLTAEDRSALKPLPAPPAGAIGPLMALGVRIGLVSIERVVPPGSIARRLR
jgi:hypothetical protein